MHSANTLGKFYRANGYQNPRRFDKPRDSVNKTADSSNSVTLCLDFVSETISNKIRNYMKQKKLPIRVNFKPGRKLGQTFCRSRPYDHKKCLQGNCTICPNIITSNKNCLVKNVVYKIICNLCSAIYIGETSKTCHDRCGEHLRYANHFKTPSNFFFRNCKTFKPL